MILLEKNIPEKAADWKTTNYQMFSFITV